MIPDIGIPDDLMPAERAVVGMAISSREHAEEIGEAIRPAHFLRPAHQVMFAAALRLAESGAEVGPLAVLTELTRTGEIRALGRPDYLHDVFSARLPGWRAHALRVREVWTEFRFREALTSALGDLEGPGFDFGGSVERLRERLDALEMPDGTPLRTMADLVNEVVGSLETQAERGLESPWRDLNDAINGLAPGQVCVIGARTSGGKSIAGGQWALHAAMRLEVPVLLASMEMSAEEITTRLLSAHSKVDLTRLLRRDLNEGDWARLNKYRGDIAESPLVIDDSSQISLAHIRSRLREMRRTEKAGLLVIDYLQLMEQPEGSESHRVGIVRLSKGLKRIAREFAIPVIVLAQLGREAEKRRPVKEDLAESSQIESDADLVLLLYRPDQQEPDSPRAGEIDVIVDKNRQGPKTTVTLSFQGHYGRIVDMAPQGDDWDPSARWAS